MLTLSLSVSHVVLLWQSYAGHHFHSSLKLRSGRALQQKELSNYMDYGACTAKPRRIGGAKWWTWWELNPRVEQSMTIFYVRSWSVFYSSSADRPAEHELEVNAVLGQKILSFTTVFLKSSNMTPERRHDDKPVRWLLPVRRQQ